MLEEKEISMDWNAEESEKLSEIWVEKFRYHISFIKDPKYAVDTMKGIGRLWTSNYNENAFNICACLETQYKIIRVKAKGLGADVSKYPVSLEELVL